MSVKSNIYDIQQKRDYATFFYTAGFFADLSGHLIIEFVPKRDSQVKKLLASRVDLFPEYTEDGMEAAFSEYYQAVK